MKHGYDEHEQTAKIMYDSFRVFKKYININKHYYHVGNTLLIGTSNGNPDIFFPPDTLVQFVDERFQVIGFIKWSRSSEGTIYLSSCDLNDGYSIHRYLEDITKYVEHNDSMGLMKIQYEVDKTHTRDIVKIMSEGDTLQLEQLEDRYIRTMFHPEMNHIWEHIKNINYYPDKIMKTGQAPRINLLLHGPPGTGKSSFAYRIAMATRRHLMSMKISKYKKDELIEVFTRPKIKGTIYSPKDVVYVLDEFDIDIDRLVLQQAGQHEQLAVVKSIMTDVLRKNSQEQIIVVQQTTSNPPSQIQTQTGSSPPSTQSPPQSPQSPQLPQPTHSGGAMSTLQDKIGKIDGMFDGLTKVYDKINNAEGEIVALRDLLTVFQGAVPINGCIIIAMTNRFDELKDRCPTLFRAGRMTPVYFGEFDQVMLNNISQHYFHQPCHLSTKQKISIQPSKVIEIVVEALMLPQGQYEYFVEKVKMIIGDL